MRCLLALLFVLCSPYAGAEAFCALRDPNHAIYSIFPEADGFRSVVDAVDENIREDVRKKLPFTLHRRELGKHTLYVVLDDLEPVGLVHVRSESSRWGLVEIAWALDMNLAVRDFRFQRCRDRGCKKLESADFKAQLVGRGLDELQAYVDADGNPVDGLDLAGANAGLVAAVLRSAMKTITVTDLVWGQDLAGL